jgi:hypothetical protein
MIVSTDLERDSHGVETCRICHKDIRQGAAIYHEGLHIEVICPECYSCNPEKDIELIGNMFAAFGGHFGMLRDPLFPVNEMLKCFLKEIQTSKGKMPKECLKIKLLHLGLLHGITPEEFRVLDRDLLSYMYQF